jgi:hypothetical protein
MTADLPSGTAGVGAAEDLRLLRRYEPVLRFTEGELFLPMPVEAYLGKCSLWRTGAKRGRAVPRSGFARQESSHPLVWPKSADKGVIFRFVWWSGPLAERNSGPGDVTRAAHGWRLESAGSPRSAC